MDDIAESQSLPGRNPHASYATEGVAPPPMGATPRRPARRSCHHDRQTPRHATEHTHKTGTILSAQRTPQDAPHHAPPAAITPGARHTDGTQRQERGATVDTGHLITDNFQDKPIEIEDHTGRPPGAIDTTTERPLGSRQGDITSTTTQRHAPPTKGIHQTGHRPTSQRTYQDDHTTPGPTHHTRDERLATEDLPGRLQHQHAAHTTTHWTTTTTYTATGGRGSHPAVKRTRFDGGRQLDWGTSAARHPYHHAGPTCKAPLATSTQLPTTADTRRRRYTTTRESSDELSSPQHPRNNTHDMRTQDIRKTPSDRCAVGLEALFDHDRNAAEWAHRSQANRMNVETRARGSMEACGSAHLRRLAPAEHGSRHCSEDAGVDRHGQQEREPNYMGRDISAARRDLQPREGRDDDRRLKTDAAAATFPGARPDQEAAHQEPLQPHLKETKTLRMGEDCHATEPPRNIGGAHGRHHDHRPGHSRQRLAHRYVLRRSL